MIRGNAVIATAGFFLGSYAGINLQILTALLLGISCVIGSGCVLNNYFDRHIDAKMDRTKNRAFVEGAVSEKKALIFAVILMIVGFGILFFTNTLAILTVFVGAIVYVGIYTPLKHISSHAALVGSISGAVPAVAGYLAAKNTFDLGAVILFFILVLWQMPHFYSIAIYRLNDYSAAGIPVLSVKKGISHTKLQMFFYILIFTLVTVSLSIFGYAGVSYALVALMLGSIWSILALWGFNPNTLDVKWARGMFIYSLVVIMVLCVTISVESVLMHHL